MRRALVVPILALACACGPPQRSKLTLEQRTVVDEARAIRYVAHQNWLPMDATLRCVLDGSFLSVHVNSLVGAKKEFVDGLPESLYPQLDEWARHDYLVEGERAVVEATVGGLPAKEVRYVVRTREEDPPGDLRFWVVRHEAYLYTFRMSLRADHRPESLDEVRTMLEGVTFLPNEGSGETDGSVTPDPSVVSTDTSPA